MTEPKRDSEVIARPVKAVCRVYGVGRSTVYEKIKDGTLRTKKAGKRTLVIEEDVRAWFDALPNGGDR